MSPQMKLVLRNQEFKHVKHASHSIQLKDKQPISLSTIVHCKYFDQEAKIALCKDFWYLEKYTYVHS